jgi:UDP-glucose 6-dehydrogenase
MKNIGLIGYGNVGRATAKNLEDSERRFVVIDEKDEVQKQATKEHGALTVSHLDAVILCINVPHPMACDLRFTNYIEVVAQDLCDSMHDVQHLLLEGAPIIVRTTVPPGTCDALQRLLPSNPVLAWPEFSKEVSMREGYELKAPYLGLPPESFDEDFGDGLKVASLILGPCGLSGELCSSNIYQNKQVEFMKLAWNVRRAVDVTVFNQMTQAAVGLGFDQYVAEHLTEQARPTAPQFSTLAFGGACLDKDLSIWDASFNETLGMMVRTINRTGPLRALQMAFKAAELLDLDEQRPVILGLQDGPGSRSTVHSPALQFMKLRKWDRAPIFVDNLKAIQERFKWLLQKTGHEDRSSVMPPDSTVLCRTNLIIIAQKSNDNSVLNALLTILRTSEAPVKVVVNAAGAYMDEKHIVECLKWGAVFIDKQELVRMTKK